LRDPQHHYATFVIDFRRRISVRFLNRLLLGSAALVVLVPPSSAHFRLLEPASWIEEDKLGDPQKAGPCGGVAENPGKPTNAVTRVQGGDKLHIKVQETVFHPGFYRVALSVNARTELPKDPEATTEPSPNGPRSISGKIVYPPLPPVLADGLFQHITRFDKEMETDVELPNINCAKCTLQVIQFMGAHGLNKEGDYTYHHCADLNIRANPYKPIDTRFPAEKK
jgi:hypothetical protein